MRFPLGAVLLVLWCSAAQCAPTLEVGSKRFTESYILGAILTEQAAPAGPVEHRKGLGNTAILLQALEQHSIDLYPEYLGTIELEILKNPGARGSLDTINSQLASRGLGVAIPFGFADSYALAVRSDTAARLGLSKLSDLAGHPELRIGVSQEFLGRADGWTGLARAYALPQTPKGLDHGLAYEALASTQIDVIDIYSTDAKIDQYHLTVLADDRRYFPAYDAVVLYRLDVPARFPAAWAALQHLAGRVDTRTMIAMNSAVEQSGRSFEEVASDFLANRPLAGRTAPAGLWQQVFAGDFWTLTREHLVLVLVSVGAALLLGVPLGTVAAVWPQSRSAVMVSVGVLQTIPALALLAFLIPVLGRIGTVPALVALFVYALLPIVRNTCTGLEEVPGGLSEAARAIGLTWWQRLFHVELPMASRIILAGVKTATVIAVGTATIAAFIGAGGYGQRITIGLALNDNTMLLAGAIPSALLALLAELGFGLADRALGRRFVR